MIDSIRCNGRRYDTRSTDACVKQAAFLAPIIWWPTQVTWWWNREFFCATLPFPSDTWFVWQCCTGQRQLTAHKANCHALCIQRIQIITVIVAMPVYWLIEHARNGMGHHIIGPLNISNYATHIRARAYKRERVCVRPFFWPPLKRLMPITYNSKCNRPFICGIRLATFRNMEFSSHQ